MSRISRSAFSRPSIHVSTSNASCGRFFCAIQRGLSGTNSNPMTKMGTGTAFEANIQRQCSPNDRKYETITAHVKPTTTANWLTVTSARECAAATLRR